MYINGVYFENVDINKILESEKIECADCIEGVLQDYAIYATPTGYIFQFVEYLNEWSSDLEYYFAHDNKPDLIAEYWDRWQAIRKAYEEYEEV